ncbi:efflux RND transporter periplasmic adaptor subunit, partial [bacterium]|nr:efflux RND transporter periplasmic adaptor subunit [bacterium]
MKLILKIAALILCVFMGSSLVFYGEKNDWFQMAESKSKELETCAHQLTFQSCAFCNPSLIESLGFCGGHGVPEAFCTRCNSSLIKAFQSIGDWCQEHKLPESQCKKCKVSEKSMIKQRTNKSDLIVKNPLKLFKKATFRSERLPNKSCSNEGALVQFLDEEVAKRIGLKFSKITKTLDSDFVHSNVELSYNENLLAHITPRASGILLNVKRGLGDLVHFAEVLAQIQSNEFSLAKSEYYQAITLVKLWQKNHDSELALQKDGATSGREVLQTETKLVESKISLANSLQKIRNLGLNEKQIQAL